ncbi:MAG: hypothetical protein KIH62_002220 [Candidatus Kerfeldbacteria bacterium]|nr:hypothetical protein [Candidatus Kerfeldbacteria bacterium]
MKSFAEYEKMYDLGTIRHCQQVERISRKVFEESQDKDKTPAMYAGILELEMYFEKNEQWLKKKETIQSWVDRETKLDALYENAVAPTGIHCKECGQAISTDFKTLHTRDGIDDVLFFYRCTEPHMGRAFFSNGAEYISSKTKCVNCHKESIESESSKKDNGDIVVNDTCTSCGYLNTYTYELSAKEPEISEEEFQKLKERYCVSDKEGRGYIEFKSSLEQLKEIFKDVDDRKNSQAKYQLIASVESLTVPNLRERMVHLLNKAAFVEVRFSEPIMKKDVQITITAEDKTSAEPRHREQELLKMIRKDLAVTNWRLMSEGISSRMGVFTFSLRGFDNPEDIKKLVEQRLKDGELKLPEVKNDNLRDEHVESAQGEKVRL